MIDILNDIFNMAYSLGHTVNEVELGYELYKKYELESLEKSAFSCAKNIIEHIEKVINEYMWKNNISLEDWQQNGEYSEVETLDGRACFLTYKKKVFHKSI